MLRRGGPDKLWGAANSLLDQFGEDTVVIGFSSEAGVLKPAGASRAELGNNFYHIRNEGTDTKMAIQLAASLIPGCTLHMIT
ncbi:MAG: VWA domain-containing protein, partial [Candidatus Eremiobacteraeota bacterium]|nr:VWA domain-containing protein [Candidatus Eremiobacteraeota bacterium]